MPGWHHYHTNLIVSINGYLYLKTYKLGIHLSVSIVIFISSTFISFFSSTTHWASHAFCSHKTRGWDLLLLMCHFKNVEIQNFHTWQLTYFLKGKLLTQVHRYILTQVPTCSISFGITRNKRIHVWEIYKFSPLGWSICNS